MSRRSWSGLVLVSLVPLLGGPTLAEGLEPDPRRLLVHGPVVLEVTRAFHGAIRRLETPACLELFDDFTDENGRTPRENLGSLTPVEYLVQLTLRDGDIPKGSGHCARPGAAAFTSGGAAVFICGRNFHNESRARQEIALIHEMLHTLGVRENPPSSAEITAAVERRCGR